MDHRSLTKVKRAQTTAVVFSARIRLTEYT